MSGSVSFRRRWDRRRRSALARIKSHDRGQKAAPRGIPLGELGGVGHVGEPGAPDGREITPLPCRASPARDISPPPMRLALSDAASRASHAGDAAHRGGPFPLLPARSMTTDNANGVRPTPGFRAFVVARLPGFGPPCGRLGQPITARASKQAIRVRADMCVAHRAISFRPKASFRGFGFPRFRTYEYSCFPAFSVTRFRSSPVSFLRDFPFTGFPDCCISG